MEFLENNLNTVAVKLSSEGSGEQARKNTDTDCVCDKNVKLREGLLYTSIQLLEEHRDMLDNCTEGLNQQRVKLNRNLEHVIRAQARSKNTREALLTQIKLMQNERRDLQNVVKLLKEEDPGSDNVNSGLVKLRENYFCLQYATQLLLRRDEFSKEIDRKLNQITKLAWSLGKKNVIISKEKTGNFDLKRNLDNRSLELLSDINKFESFNEELMQKDNRIRNILNNIAVITDDITVFPNILDRMESRMKVNYGAILDTKKSDDLNPYKLSY